MIIDQLPELDSVQETDEIPVEQGTRTYKATLQKLKDLVASLLTKADIGLENVANERQYSAQNPPPYPVISRQAVVKAVTGNGSSNNTLSGLTENYVVGNWGLFSDAACTMPIPINKPPCDITISTSENAWTLTIANFSSTFYIRPTFILIQN